MVVKFMVTMTDLMHRHGDRRFRAPRLPIQWWGLDDVALSSDKVLLSHFHLKVKEPRSLAYRGSQHAPHYLSWVCDYRINVNNYHLSR